MRSDSPISPSVAVVVPVRNGAAFILRAIKSIEMIAAAGSLDISAIVIDDGAREPLDTPLERSFLRLPVSFLQGDQDGPSAARNLGIRTSDTDYLAFLDVDDALLGGFSQLLQHLLLLDDLGRAPDIVRGRSILVNSVSGQRTVMPPSWLPGTYVVRRQALLDVGGFDAERAWGEHHELGSRLAASGEWRIVDIDAIDPVAVKFDDRSSAVVLGYAKRRYQSALLARSELQMPSQLARNSDVATVSLARLSEWESALTAAKDAASAESSARRQLRRLLIRIPGLRWIVYQGRLHTNDIADHTRSVTQAWRRAFSRPTSSVLALVRHRAKFRAPSPKS